MTVVVSFRCTDGIVLCAGQQVFKSGAFKCRERTITVEAEARQSIVLAYSGLPALAREARQEMRKKIGHAEIPSDLLYLAADEVLTEMGRHHPNMDLRLLIGRAAVCEDPTLFEFDGRALHVADDISFIGVGNSSLLHFLAATIYSPQMNVEEATNLAIYLIDIAEQSTDHCGGPMKIAKMKCGDPSCEILPEEDVLKRLKIGISNLGP